MVTEPPYILIVDDEADNCTNMADIFSEFGYRVDVAYDGPAALALVEKRRYDVALLDLMMPGMDGATLYEEIKKRRAATVAIIITAHPGHPRASFAVEAGAWKLLPKPVDITQVLQMIDNAAGQPLLLIVDDDSDFCQNLWDLLRDCGYRPCVAHNVANANRFLSENGEYDLILVDMKLPDGDGGAVVETALQIHPGIPIVLITGYRAEFESKIPELLSQGAKDVLPKPVEVPTLLQTVERLTGRA